MSATVATLAQTLAQRAESSPDLRAFTYLLDGESDEVTLTFGELHLRAQTLAAQLREQLDPGTRVLLLLPPGFDYLEAVWGCFYANVIGVSAAPPQPKRLHRTLPRLLAIAADAQVDGVLCTAEIRDAARPLLAEGPLATASWFVADKDARAVEDWSIPSADPHEIAFLQYTSGSTAQPRGVMLTHANLLTNLDLIGKRFDAVAASARGGRLLVWLPPYHDMGLIGGLLQAVYTGFDVVLMSPIAVIKRPERWLQAISRYRASASGGPNFSYDLCVRRIGPEIREQLDLSCWDTAFNGAEPIRARTIEAFCEAFATCGFQRSAFLPCYGLAEATLLVTGSKRPDGPTLADFDSDGLLDGCLMPAEPGRPSTRLVGCGDPVEGHEVAIVDPQTLRRCPPGRIGEIWVSGPSVAPGYWNQPAGAADFHARITGEDEMTFLRTGDLGALHGDDLFVTGRIKELLILHGRNIHPHDLEQSAEDAHVALRPHCSAAFTIEDGERTEVALVLEVQAGTEDLDHIMDVVRRRVAAEFDVQLQRIALVAPGSIPKTTSGKLQRLFTRELLLSGELELLACWQLAATA